MTLLPSPSEVTQKTPQHPASLPAGGNDPERFNSQEAWYPVYYLEDLSKTSPTAFTLLGEDLVIWWDRNTQSWRAFADSCPHRLARLSEGRIAEDGLLECPYHGWAFSGAGNCDRLPQADIGSNAQQSKRACAKVYATVARQGLLFIYGGELENAAQVQVPIIEVLEDSDPDWICFGTFRDLPYDALTLLENVLDASHLPFTHHRSVGNRANAAPLDLEVLASGKQGFEGTWAEGPRLGKLGRQDTTFVAPNLMWHEIDSKAIGRTLTVVYATPTCKGECRLFARFPFKFAAKLPRIVIGLTPKWYSHLGQNSILEDDQIFLHHQERYLAAKGGSSQFAKSFFLASKADLYVAELHKWLNQFHADPFPGQTLPPALTKDQLLDRYHSHTKHCQSCRDALQNLQRLRLGLAISAVIAVGISPFFSLSGQIGTTVFLSIFAAIALTSWGSLAKLEQRFYRGNEIPARNR